MIKRFVYLLLIIVSLSSVACAGFDPMGGVNEKRSNANKVLLALNDYQSDVGDMPKSLNDLVPKYLENIPAFPGLRFNRLEKSIYYDEDSDWMGNVIVCSAKVGSDYWRCRKHG